MSLSLSHQNVYVCILRIPDAAPVENIGEKVKD